LNFDAIEKIDSNILFNKYEGSTAEADKKFVKRVMQYEIITKINILFEDLAILAELTS
jgi:hypothetical protein